MQYDKPLHPALHWESQQSLVCMVSGGVDSMVVLHYLSHLKHEIAFSMHAVHFNFHLRQEESERDEQFVRDQCAMLDLELIVYDAPIKSQRGIEEKARDLRYNKIIQESKNYGWTHVVTGHHANDQIETILMHCYRGARARGFKGMDVERRLSENLVLVRPILEWSREDIDHYAQLHGISFIQDSSNLDTKYFRNYLRHEVIPQLEAHHFLSSLKKVSELARAQDYEDHKEFTDFRNEHLEKNIIAQEGYEQLSMGARFYLIEHMLRKAGFKKQLTSALFEELDHLCQFERPVSKMIGDIILYVGYGKVCVQEHKVQCEASWFMKIEGPGSYWINHLQKYLHLKALQLHPHESLRDIMKDSLLNQHPETKSLFLSGRILKFPLTLRHIHPGDRFHPFGRPGTKKVKKFFVDQCVPHWKRPLSLVLCEGDQIICLVGYEIDHRVACCLSDQYVWKLSLED